MVAPSRTDGEVVGGPLNSSPFPYGRGCGWGQLRPGGAVPGPGVREITTAVVPAEEHHGAGGLVVIHGCAVTDGRGGGRGPTQFFPLPVRAGLRLGTASSRWCRSRSRCPRDNYRRCTRRRAPWCRWPGRNPWLRRHGRTGRWSGAHSILPPSRTGGVAAGDSFVQVVPFQVQVSER